MKSLIAKERLLELFDKHYLDIRRDVVTSLGRFYAGDSDFTNMVLLKWQSYPDHRTLILLLNKLNFKNDDFRQFAQMYDKFKADEQKKSFLKEVIVNFSIEQIEQLLPHLNPDSDGYEKLTQILEEEKDWFPSPVDALNHLREHCTQCDDARTDSDLRYCRRIVKYIIPHKDVLSEQVCEMAIGDFTENYLFEEYLVKLCGVWKLGDSVNGLLLKLEQDLGDYLNQALMDALGGIGSEQVVRLIGERYHKYSEHAKIMATEVLCNIPTEETESLLLDLFHKETEGQCKTFIASALCEIFSRKAIEPILKFAETDEFDYEIVSPLEILRAVYVYHGLIVPEDLIQLDHKLTEKRIKMRQSFFGMDPLNTLLVEPEISKSGKTGRNEPCTCGSGKKYKKCCLQR